jgi:mutator protein MutT
MQPRQVEVAIAVILHEGLILICQRRDDDPLGGLWEFPGGKQEPGETPEQCLSREIAEELGITVRPTERLASIDWKYPAVAVRLRPYLCELAGGEPAPLACQQIAWVKPAALLGYSFPPANRQLIESLARRFG